MKLLYWISLGKLQEEKIRIELLMQKRASLSYWETTFGMLIAAECMDMNVLIMHQAIFCRPSPVFSIKE